MRLWILLAWLLAAFGAPAGAQVRSGKVALIIANSSYQYSNPLSNPQNDGTLVAAAARRAGFQTVTLASDLGRQEFEQVLREFRTRAEGADVAMVYFAGHGIEGQGRNWLIPTDARLASALDLPYEAIDLERVLEAVSGAQIRIVVLDACRNNPFGRSWRSGSRSVSRGLSGVEVDDVLVIYAAAPGQAAADGAGSNSPFATSFARRLAQPGLAVQLLGGMVRDDVLQATGGAQRPYVSASITGTPVYLLGNGPSAPATAAPAAVPAAGTVDSASLDVLAWQAAAGANTIEAYTEYQRQFPNGRFATFAAQSIARLSASDEPAGLVEPDTVEGRILREEAEYWCSQRDTAARERCIRSYRAEDGCRVYHPYSQNYQNCVRERSGRRP